MVVRHDNNTLEVFQTITQNTTTFNYEIQKAVIDLTNMSVTFVTLPLCEYAISSCVIAAVTYIGYKHGIYFNDEYYMPTITQYYNDILYNTYYNTGGNFINDNNNDRY